jgi:hypothetical protein
MLACHSCIIAAVKLACVLACVYGQPVEFAPLVTNKTNLLQAAALRTLCYAVLPVPDLQ